MWRLHTTSTVSVSVALLFATLQAQTRVDTAGWQKGTHLEKQVVGSGTETLRVPIAAGYFIRVEVEQKGADLIVALRNPQGQKLLEADSDNARYGPETVVAITESAGEYQLEVRNSQSQPARYEVNVVEWRKASSSDGELIAAYRTYAEGYQLRQRRTPTARREAIDKLTLAKDSFRRVPDRYMYGVATISLGATLGDDGRFREALTEYDEATALFRGLRDTHMEAMALTNAAGALDVLGEPRKALQLYREALSTNRDGDRTAEANLLNNIALTERSLGDPQSTLLDYQQALMLARDAGDRRLEGLILSNTGVAYRELGEVERSIEFLRQALPLRHVSGDNRGEATTLVALAEAQLLLHQPDQALDQIKESIAIAMALGDKRLQAHCLESRGMAYTNAGRAPEAVASLLEALNLARGVQDRRETAVVLLNLGRAGLLSKQVDKGAAWSAQAAAEFRAIGDGSSEALALEMEARAEDARGMLLDARQHIEESLRLDEVARRGTDSEQLRASFFATRQDGYSFYVDLLMRAGAVSEALEANERAHARSLLEMLSEAGSTVRAGADAKLVARQHEISERLNARGAKLLQMAGASNPRSAELTSEIRALETEYQDVQAEIRRSSPKYAALTEPHLLTAEQIRTQLLDPDTLLLEYSLGDERSYLWLVSSDGVRAFALPKRTLIEDRVKNVLQLLTSRADSLLAQPLRETSETVLGGAAQYLSNKRLVIVPDGVLQTLPFAMLPDGNTADPLLVRHEIVMEASASAIAAERVQVAGRKPASRMLAVFADPVFGPEDPRAGGITAARPGKVKTVSARASDPTVDGSRVLEHLSQDVNGAGVNAGNSAGNNAKLKIPRLPYTAQEADQILAVASGPSNLKAVGFEATRAKAVSGQLGEYRYLHFATHGYLDTERPSLSALVLAQIDARGQMQDGFLRVNDIYDAQLSADLAVLSACQTGLGKEVRGEGLMGLTRAFLYAGVPRVIVSLWNVNDRATADLMASLYRGMLREGKTPAAALREAQLELRKKNNWQSPYYWAAFEQQGDWR